MPLVKDSRMAVHIRLSQQLKEALVQASAGGLKATLRFGDDSQPNAIRVGDRVFEFTAHEESNCDLIRVPRDSSASVLATDVGPITQRLYVKRNLDDERERVRSRSEQASAKQHERQAVLLDGGAKRPTSKAAAARPVLSHRTAMMNGAGKPPTAPAVQRGRVAILPPQQHAKQLSSHKEAPRTAKPPTQTKPQQAKQSRNKGTAQRNATPPPRTASPSLLEADTSLDAEMDAVVRKPAAKQPKQTAVPARPSPLGIAGSSPTAPPAAKAPPPAQAVMAARQGSLRLCAIALLADRGYTRKGFDQALADAIAATGGKGLRAPPTTEVKRMLDAVSEFKAPGRHVLRSERLRGELAALDQPPAEAEASAVPMNGASKGAGGKGKKRAAGKAAGSPAGAGPGGGAKSGAAGIECPGEQHVSKKRKMEKPANAGKAHGGGRARGTEGSEPQVLNRQQVQPQRPADPADDWVVSGAKPQSSKGSRKHLQQGPGLGSEAGRQVWSDPPPVRWDIDVAAALGIGRAAAPVKGGQGGHGIPRGVSPSVATSGAWASTSFGGSFPGAPLPGPERMARHAQPLSRSLSAASAREPGDAGGPVAALPQGVSRLKIKLRVPSRSKSVGAASAEGSRRSSASGGRSARAPYDDSWFAEHVGREPRKDFAIHDESQCKVAKQEHRDMHGIYIRLHKEKQAHQAEIQGLQEAVEQASTAEEAAKWAGQIEVLQRRRAPQLASWRAAFDVLHVELRALKAAITSFKAAAGAS